MNDQNVLDSNYVSIENYSTSASYALASTMDKLLTPEEGRKPDSEEINQAIDCAETLVKVLAIFHKGREIEQKRQAFNSGIIESGKSPMVIEHDNEAE